MVILMRRSTYMNELLNQDHIGSSSRDKRHFSFGKRPKSILRRVIGGMYVAPFRTIYHPYPVLHSRKFHPIFTSRPHTVYIFNIPSHSYMCHFCSPFIYLKYIEYYNLTNLSWMPSSVQFYKWAMSNNNSPDTGKSHGVSPAVYIGFSHKVKLGNAPLGTHW